MASVAGSSAVAVSRELRRRRLARLATGLVGIGSAAAATGAGWPAAVDGALVTAGLIISGSALLAPSGRAADRWRRGAEGERRTAALLDELPSRRWSVWHDLPVPGSRANVDHLVVGRTGVWVIDTKTTRSAVKARWRSVRFGDRRLDSGPTRWECEVIGERLQRLVGHQLRRPLEVRPLIAVHGPGLRRRGGLAGGVPVVPAEGLAARLGRGRARLGRRDRRLIADAVSAHLTERERRP